MKEDSKLLIFLKSKTKNIIAWLAVFLFIFLSSWSNWIVSLLHALLLTACLLFTSDIELTFRNEWGMGIANFNATWTEIGSAEDQYDLQNSGLIDIGGV